MLRDSKLLAIIILCCLGLLVYSNTFLNSFHFDDYYSIVQNVAIRNIASLRNIWNFWPTRFITYLSIAFNYYCGGLNVFDYHLFNLLVHLGSGLMVWYLTGLTLKTFFLRKEPIAAYAGIVALFAAAIFLSHPIQTQPVNYIIQRATLLAGFFYIASLCFYAKARLAQGEKTGAHAWKMFYALSFLAAIMGMFSKENAISLPLAVCLYELCFLKTGKSSGCKHIIPYFVLALIIPLTMALSKSVDFQGVHRIAEGSPGISPAHYFLTQLRVMVTYIRLLFVPVNQNVDYYYPVLKSFFKMPVILSILLLITILSFGIRIFRKNRLLSFGVFYFFIALLPESSVIPIADVIFEHRLYLPMVGFSLFLVGGAYYLFKGKRIKLIFILLFLLVLCYSGMAYQRNKVWKDGLTLWDDAVRKSPLKARPYCNRAAAYKDRGEFDLAIADYNKAIELNPKYAEAYSNRGVAYALIGNSKQALSDFLKAIELQPRYAPAYNNRAVEYFRRHEYDKAWDDVHRAQTLGYEVNPQFLEDLKKASGKIK